MAKSIFLSAGHGGNDPGAVVGNRKEADVAVEFRNMVSFYLSRAGVKHELDGKGTENLPLSEAVKIAKRNQIAVEFHTNAAGQYATGTEALSGQKDIFLAAELAGAIARTLGLRNRGAKPENAGQHHRLAFVQAGGIIVELFFLTCAADRQAYDARKWLAAKAVADILMAAAK